MEHPEEARADQMELSVVLDHLLALRFLTTETKTDLQGFVTKAFDSVRRNANRTPTVPKDVRVDVNYLMTPFGIEFVRACSGPKSRRQEAAS